MYLVNKAYFLIFLLISLSLSSQELGGITIYNTENSDLAYNQINCLEFGEDGALWIGTQNGLNILETNGSWSYFDTNTPNSQLASNIIHTLEWAQNLSPPTMFIGTNAGISTANTNAWTENYGWTCDPNNSVINSLLYSNTLWSGAVEGLCIEGMGSKGDWLMKNTETGFYSNHITSIKKNANTNLIGIGTMNGGLITFDDTFNIYYSSNSDILDNTVFDLAFDNNNNIIICTPQAGLGVLTENNDWIWLNTINSELPTNSLRNVIVDNNNNLWISTLEDGLVQYSSNSFYHYTYENSNLPDNNINCLIYGPNNNLWLGTNSGLVKINMSNMEVPESKNRQPKIYPTSFDSKITIECFQKTDVKIFNIEGKLIKQCSLAVGRNFINTINYRSGFYIIHVTSKNFQKSYKLFKTN